MEGFDRAKSEQGAMAAVEPSATPEADVEAEAAEVGALVQQDAAESGVAVPRSLSELEELISAAAGDDVDADDIRRIVYGAGELKAQEMMLHQAIQQELAAQMTYEDLPEELQTKVRQFRESSGPKFDPTQAASALLGKWREIRAQRQPTTVAEPQSQSATA